ncbi:alpha/beta fold hydrolase, partial [Nonomuraea aridisoli]
MTSKRNAVAALLGTAIAATALTAAATPAGADVPAKPAKPTVVLVHGAFADASSWNGVVQRLQHDGYKVIAPANPLRSLAGDTASIAALLKTIEGPIILAGHSYGSQVATNAARGNANVKALVSVAGFLPDVGESAATLSGKFPGSTLGPTLT